MKFKILPILVVALAVSACGGASASTGASAPSGSTSVEMSQPAAQATAAPAAGGEVGDRAVDSYGTGSTTNEPNPQVDQQGFNRLVIKTADMSIQVENVRAAEAEIRTRAATLGGYIVQSQSNGADQDLSMNLSFRVPVARFDEALSDVQGIAKKVYSSTVRGDDVTEEFVDLESRQKTLTATRDRLLQLLAEAKTVEETLQVNQTLNEYQAQIDQVEGRIKYLSQSAAMSTINVALAPVPAVQPIIEEGWQPVAVARAALRDLLEFGQGIANIAIVLAIWSPVWGALILVGLLVTRRLRRPSPAAKTTA